jgi:hypothetical protein
MQYWIACYDSSIVTLDDFRFNGKVILYAKSECLFPKAGDWVVLFDKNNNSITGHGSVINEINQQIEAPGNYIYSFTARLSSVKNKPLKLSLNKLFLNKSLQFNNAFILITRDEFDEIFYKWWGVIEFSNDILKNYKS